MIILDLETSGLEAKKDKIIEFAAVKIDENLNEIDRLNFFVNPEMQVSNEVLKITGIKQEILDKSPTFQEKIPEIEKFLEGDRTIIGHNISFDIGFLQEWGFLQKNNFLDTFILSSIFFEKQDSYALEVLSDKFKIDHEFKHRAIGDVLANLDLFRKIVGKIKKIKSENSEFFELIEKNIGNKIGKDGRNGKYFNLIEDVKTGLIGENIEIFSDLNQDLELETKKSEIIKKSENKNFNLKQDSEGTQELFEFATKNNLFNKIEEFFYQNGENKEKKLLIIPSFLRNLVFEKYEYFPEINIIYGEKFHGSEKKFFELISDDKKFSHIKNLDTREFFELKILLAISKKVELNLKNIHISYDEYELWSKIIDDEKLIFIGEKNLIEFKDFTELKNRNLNKKKQQDKAFCCNDIKKLFIEPEINFEDRTNFASLNYVIDKIGEDEKNILKEKLKTLKNFLISENFSEEDEKKYFGDYGKTVEINYKKISEGDWGFFQNFEDKDSENNLAFSTEGRKKAEEKGKKFLEELKIFGEEFRKILFNKKNFSGMEQNLEKFLDSNNSNNFHKFIKISENNISFSAQKIDLISEFAEVFKNSSFGFFGGGLKIDEKGKQVNSSTKNAKNFNFIKKIFGLKNTDFKENFEDKKIFFSFPVDPYAPGPKNQNYGNFTLNKISEICGEKFGNKDGQNKTSENIGIITNNKKDLENIYKNLLENYPDFEIYAEGLCGGKNKIIHKINESKKFILIAQKDFFEKLFTDSEQKIDFLIFTKLPFDPPTGIFKLRQEFYNGSFGDYVIPKSLLKTKQIILASGTENVFFMDKRVGSDAWAKNYCNI